MRYSPAATRKPQVPAAGSQITSSGVGAISYDIAGGHALLIGAGGVLVQANGEAVVHGQGGFAGCVGGAPQVVAHVLRCRPQAGGKRVPRHPARPAKRIADPLILDRAQGVLLGLLAGDALGAQVEFLDAATIRARHPNGVTELRAGGTWNLLAGQPTDDGEMALALARSLVAGRGDGAARAAYLAWGQSRPFDMGATTRAGLDAMAGRGRLNPQSQANGALMRAAPIGIAAKGVPNRAGAWARRDAALTHPHPVCQSANAAFCAAIAVGVAGGDREAMFMAAYDFAIVHDGLDAQPVRDVLRAAATAAPAEFMRNQGWVLIALQNAFHHLVTGTPLAEAIITTVAQGGDTDTNAAICGALLGAAEGRSALPTSWQSRILGCRALPLPHVTHPRPATCWPDDALELAEALLTFAKN